MSSSGIINYSGAATDFGAAANDLFSSAGSAQSAQSYGQAATIAQENVGITERGTAITEAQTQRSIIQATGSEAADVAGAGQTAGGSSLYLMRSSLQQGALQKQLVQTQGDITAQGFQQQATAYTGQEQAAKTQSKGQAAGGLLGIVGGALSIFGL